MRSDAKATLQFSYYDCPIATMFFDGLLPRPAGVRTGSNQSILCIDRLWLKRKADNRRRRRHCHITVSYYDCQSINQRLKALVNRANRRRALSYSYHDLYWAAAVTLDSVVHGIV